MKYRKTQNSHIRLWLGALCLLITGISNAASTKDRLIEEVIVTATKKNTLEHVQDVPIAMSAFTEDQINALKLQDVTDVSLAIPNVDLQPVGTSRATARFSIRGWAPTSSIASIDPTVGTLIDGLYLPSNTGVIYDTFDLASIEVLRGPQGVLFGRNVVGGAVLINTKKPSEEFEAQVKVRGESGLRGTGENMTYTGIVTGPITDGLRGKFAVYHNKDAGWFKNEFNGDNFDKSETTLVRGALSWDLGDTANFLLSYEHGHQDGDQQPNQSHDNRADGNPGLFSRGGHKMTSDLEEGFQKAEWDQVIFTSNIDVSFGDGTITNIFGYRDYENRTFLDIDGVDALNFHSFGGAKIEFFSNELRYFGTFGDLSVTTGIYYLESEITIQSQRQLFGFVAQQNSGGTQDAETKGIFFNADYQLNEKLNLSFGLRYTEEDKEATSAALANNTTTGCGPLFGPVPCINDVVDESDDWSNLSHKIGFSYGLNDDALIYGHWSRSFRAGGYNLRRSTVTADRESFDEEQVDQYEIGFKADFNENVRLNLSAFFSQGQDLQRLILDPITIFQVTANTADADIYGIELDTRIFLTEQLTLIASAGYMHAEYTKVLFDLNGDGVVDQLDEDLDLPAVPELTNSISFIYDTPVGSFGTVSSQLTYSHRGDIKSVANNNLLNSRDVIDLNISLFPNEANWEVSLYGKNLTNDVFIIQDTPISSRLGSTIGTLGKGRRFGLEFKYNFN